MSTYVMLMIIADSRIGVMIASGTRTSLTFTVVVSLLFHGSEEMVSQIDRHPTLLLVPLLVIL
jgi:hypothetical protein